MGDPVGAAAAVRRSAPGKCGRTILILELNVSALRFISELVSLWVVSDITVSCLKKPLAHGARVGARVFDAGSSVDVMGAGRQSHGNGKAVSESRPYRQVNGGSQIVSQTVLKCSSFFMSTVMVPLKSEFKTGDATS